MQLCDVMGERGISCANVSGHAFFCLPAAYAYRAIASPMIDVSPVSAPAKPFQGDQERKPAPDCHHGDRYPLRTEGGSLQNDGTQSIV